MFSDSHVAIKIFQTETALDCKCLSYQINGGDNTKWHNEGYEICLDGIHEKFNQNPALLSMLRIVTLKIPVEPTGNVDDYS